MAIKFTEVVDSGGGWVTVRADDGNLYTLKGEAAWRGNNPGNIRPPGNKKGGSYGGSIGVMDTGSNGLFLVFPDREAGNEARRRMLFSPDGSYSKMTLRDGFMRYAPPEDNNDSEAYIAALASAAGVSPDTVLGELTKKQQDALLHAQLAVEGNRPGTIMAADGTPVPASVVRQFRGAPLPPGSLPDVGSGLSVSAYSTSNRAGVKELQTQLKRMGFDPGTVDGVMGPRTKAAVKEFQKQNGLKTDGIVGPQTSAVLVALGGAASPNRVPATVAPYLSNRTPPPLPRRDPRQAGLAPAGATGPSNRGRPVAATRVGYIPGAGTPREQAAAAVPLTQDAPGGRRPTTRFTPTPAPGSPRDLALKEIQRREAVRSGNYMPTGGPGAFVPYIGPGNYKTGGTQNVRPGGGAVFSPPNDVVLPGRPNVPRIGSPGPWAMPIQPSYPLSQPRPMGPVGDYKVGAPQPRPASDRPSYSSSSRSAPQPMPRPASRMPSTSPAPNRVPATVVPYLGNTRPAPKAPAQTQQYTGGFKPEPYTFKPTAKEDERINYIPVDQRPVVPMSQNPANVYGAPVAKPAFADTSFSQSPYAGLQAPSMSAPAASQPSAPRPPSSSSSSSSQPRPSAPAQQTFKGSSTGKTYVVGKVYQLADGTKKVANANGTFSKI